MTANVALAQLVPGDEVLDLVAAGTVQAVDELRHTLRNTTATRVTFTDGTMICGRPDYTVVTKRELVDA